MENTSQLTISPVDIMVSAAMMKHAPFHEENGQIRDLTSKEEAKMYHDAFVDVIATGKTAAAATRQLAVQMYRDDRYKLVEIPYPDDPKETMTFDTYRDWLAYAVEDVSGMSDTLTSSLNSFMRIVDLSLKGLLRYPDGKEITVEDLLDLREGHMQKVSSAINRILQADPDYPDLDKAGLLVSAALDPDVKGDDLVDLLREQGVSNPRSAKVEVQVAIQHGKTLYLIDTDDELVKAKVELIFGNRVDWRTVAPEDIVEEVTTWAGSNPYVQPLTVELDPEIEPDIEPVTAEEYTSDEFKDYLSSMI